MTIGTGIALVAVWGVPMICAVNRTVTAPRFTISLVVALVATWLILGVR